jgi:hypothetical protein
MGKALKRENMEELRDFNRQIQEESYIGGKKWMRWKKSFQYVRTPSPP